MTEIVLTGRVPRQERMRAVHEAHLSEAAS